MKALRFGVDGVTPMGVVLLLRTLLGSSLGVRISGEDPRPSRTRQHRRSMSFPLLRVLLWSLGVLGHVVPYLSVRPMFFFYDRSRVRLWCPIIPGSTL